MHGRYCIHLFIQYTTSGLSNNSICFHLFNILAHPGISLFLMGWITQISPYITSHSICIWWTCVYWATVSISDPPDLHIPHRPCIMCSPIIIAGNMSDHLVIWYIYSTHIYRQSVLSPWAPTHFLACLELYVHIYHHLSLLFTSLHL